MTQLSPLSILTRDTVLICGLLWATSCVVDLPDRHFDQGASPDTTAETQAHDTVPQDMPKPDQSLCGNGHVDPGELCDTAISDQAEGACPRTNSDCPDFDPCTTSRVEGGLGCQAHCVLALVTTCGANDGCCPAACANVSTEKDEDCPRPKTAGGTCGDKVVNRNSKETCDGDCPSSCAPKACKNGQIVGSAETCTARCLYLPAPDGKDCSEPKSKVPGTCHEGACCLGCWNGTTCVPGNAKDACGQGGGDCKVCSADETCCADFTCKKAC